MNFLGLLSWLLFFIASAMLVHTWNTFRKEKIMSIFFLLAAFFIGYIALPAYIEKQNLFSYSGYILLAIACGGVLGFFWKKIIPRKKG